MLNEDYKDMLLALSGEKVRYLLIGAYALAAHGYPRATMDIDIWVMQSPKNAGCRSNRQQHGVRGSQGIDTPAYQMSHCGNR